MSDAVADQPGFEVAERLLPTAPAGGDYNVLPYRSVPYAQSQPAHLAAVARMFGLSAPDPHTASVLELGCAAGGNIIPLAVRHPEARFLGVDLTERQVADGQARIAALGLSNIEIRQGDIATVDLSGETFDYMICHGTYSWIPPEAQDAVMRLTAETLSPEGVAYVSYNTFPGWHLRNIVRDACIYHAGTGGSPEHRVARARWALEKLATLSPETTPYGQALRNEAKLNATLPDSYILGEFLAEHNAPCHFHEFVERAALHGLHYLAETDIASSIPELLEPGTAEAIRQIAGGSGMAAEQYMDFFVGRQFRRTLLVKRDGISRSLGPHSLTDLHLTSLLRRDEEKDEGSEKRAYASPRGTIHVASRPLITLLDGLEEAAPGTVSTETMLDMLPASDEVRVEALKAVFRLVLTGHVDVAAVPLAVGRASDERPEIWEPARIEAAAQQSWVSSLRHAPVGLSVNVAPLLPLIDGTRTHAELVREAGALVANGTVRVKGFDPVVQSTDVATGALGQIGASIIEQVLGFAKRSALLAPKTNAS